jgi:GLPGLI family protein
MKKLLVYFSLAILPFNLLAQEIFISEGRIEYERRINLHRQPEEDEGSDWFKDIIKTMPNFHSSAFTLQFRGTETMYKPAGEMTPIKFPWLMGPAKENIVYTNLEKNEQRSFKSVFEENFLITDSTRNMNWRMTDEKRTIAGIECRKAVGRICDSVYVVAFYADEIPVSGGPESFNGLPGMILGLVIPRLHTTWFATKVTLAAPATKDFEITSKGQRTNKAKLEGTLGSSMKNWGRYGHKNIWWTLL